MQNIEIIITKLLDSNSRDGKFFYENIFLKSKTVKQKFTQQYYTQLALKILLTHRNEVMMIAFIRLKAQCWQSVFIGRHQLAPNLSITFYVNADIY